MSYPALIRPADIELKILHTIFFANIMRSKPDNLAHPATNPFSATMIEYYFAIS